MLKGKGQGGKEGFWIKESSFQQWPHRPHPLQSVAGRGGHWGPKLMPLAPRPLSTAGTSARAGLVFPSAQTVRSLGGGELRPSVSPSTEPQPDGEGPACPEGLSSAQRACRPRTGRERGCQTWGRRSAPLPEAEDQGEEGDRN